MSKEKYGLPSLDRDEVGVNFHSGTTAVVNAVAAPTISIMASFPTRGDCTVAIVDKSYPSVPHFTHSTLL